METAFAWTSINSQAKHVYSFYREAAADASQNVSSRQAFISASVELVESSIPWEGDASERSLGTKCGPEIEKRKHDRGALHDTSPSHHGTLVNLGPSKSSCQSPVTLEENTLPSSIGAANGGVCECRNDDDHISTNQNRGFCETSGDVLQKRRSRANPNKDVSHVSSTWGAHSPHGSVICANQQGNLCLSPSASCTPGGLRAADSIKASLSCKECAQIPFQSSIKKSPPLVKSKSANCILGRWHSERENFNWIQCKAEVLCALASFNLLLVLILLDYWITGRHRVAFILPWLATLVCASLLFGALLLDFVRYQAFCFYASPVLFILAFLSWLIPSFSSASASKADEGFFANIGLLVSVSLSWLLSAAPIMAWQAALFLALAMPFLLLTTFFARVTAAKFSVDSVVLFPIVVLLVTTNVLLWHVRSVKASRFLQLIDSWADAFLEGKEHEEQALKALDEREMDNADRISKMRQFISYVFHEIRVPFNAVMLGIGHLLASDMTTEQEEILNMMDLSSSSMIRILNDVLDMGKIEAGKLHLERQPFNVGEMVSSLVWAFKDTMDSKGIEFLVCIDPITKQLFSSYDLLGDKHRVRQVIANYLSNATKFTARGGKVTLRIVCNGISNINPSSSDVEATQLPEGRESFAKSIGHSRNGTGLSAKSTDKVVSITVSVEDTGIGISKEDQELLFEPYIQICASSSQGGGGTGLGLSFARRIVELAGGKIGASSELGKGSIFEFTMPFQLVEYVEDKEGAGDLRNVTSSDCQTARPPTTDTSADKPKVLIVEDNLVNRKIIRKLLESFSICSDDAEDGKQAVERMREGHTYDMILIDKEMPVMDGHEATRQLRAMGVKSPIIGLTGNALNSDRNEFIAAGVDDFFTKPISRHQLVKLLEAYGLLRKAKDKTQLPKALLEYGSGEFDSSQSAV